MSRKPKKGYFVRGQFVAEGSELDLELKRELKGGDAPSKTERKAHSDELQTLGEALLSLRSDLMAPLALPDKLHEALAEARRITSFEGKRRQMQFIGKLMRKLDDDTLSAVRHALALQRLGHAHHTAALHEAEQWRERLLADDRAAADWMNAHPATDAQQLRALVRQARKDATPADATAQVQARHAQAQGLAPRHGRAYRELFQLIKAALTGGAVDALEDEADGTAPASRSAADATTAVDAQDLA